MELTTERVGRLTKAVNAKQEFDHEQREGRFDGTPVETLNDARANYQAEVAFEVADLVGDYVNVLSGESEKLLADAFARLHPTLLAGILRTVLLACQQHPGDGRIPEWAQQPKSVPLV